ncbi:MULTISPECIES: cytochrome-c oxidase, cbb3-type subunit III [unclassified Agarivorans]|uniref:cytochrome-c oxidase, cbb3-type subunit III n=1 Tax=unclassified Agarivorans TaxID=2636026 RepID=UPI0026E23F97|nr:MULTISPECIES: cytochrome-c oxidase, cbb3-type subunit III [unclassified Agarivorans]MDO6685903.1 cytochrome-c oxidase, cbb3-type subunit III [Agarivorans sp. 3_MG-2023]MDO6713959.1 cytochrome-c oxidase, cbb3-type subunit III [Agarivorans sp. 2_MG-2023]
MSTFWSVWVTVITLGSILGCYLLLRACNKNNTGVKEGESMGHEFDGIEELNNPLPKWWSYMFIITIVFSLIYLAAYPGLGNWQGFLGWKSAEQDIKSVAEGLERIAAKDPALASQYDRERKAADNRFGEVFTKIAYDSTGEYRSVEELSVDPDAIKIGQRLFLQNCSQCHGSTARGGKGFPNLTDGDWLYGGSGEAIKASLMHGRQGQMPAWEAVLGDDGIKEVTAYVLSLSGRKVNDIDAAAGKNQFAVCAACHGADGTGSEAVGAPNLTNGIWLYGGSRRAVEDTLRYGRNGVMPAWKDILGEDKIQLISAYVYQLSKSE